MTFRCLVLALAVVGSPLPGVAATSGVRGSVSDPAGLPLPGVLITVLTLEQATEDRRTVASGVTDEHGEYMFAVPPGRYELTAELSGFQVAERMVVVQPSDLTTVDMSLAMAAFQDSVTVRADTTPPSLLGTPQPNAPATISRTVINSAMLRNSRYEDVLTLMPNVMRGPDNRISIGGAPASTGSLVVNGFNETDPAGGQPGVVIPVDAVDSVDVRTGGYAADLGRATSGVTSIHTRSGADQFHTSVDSIFPRLLFENGSVHGVEYWEPNIGFSGPIVKRRLFFEDALSYRFDRNRFSTLAGPERSTYNQPLFWSQLDVNVSSRQHLRFGVALGQQHTDHANITAFTPDTSVPQLAEDGWSTMFSDRLTFARTATVELNASVLRTDSSVDPNGLGPYQLGHHLASGSYFDQQSRRARRVEGGGTVTVMPSSRQVVKMGATVDQAALDEADTASPVRLLRDDGTVSRTISFTSQPASRVQTLETAGFVQDSWTPRPSLVMDFGVRYDRIAAVGNGLISPRIGWTIKRDDDRMSISGSVGRFADKLVLSALDFGEFPTRTVAQFDLDGRATESVRQILNTIAGPLLVPRAERWDIGVDRTFTAGWLAHVRYQERYSHDELLLLPSVNDEGVSLLTLSSNGRSTTRSVETTIGYRHPESGHEFYASYVRSSARGDLNTFDSIEGLFKDPFVQPNQTGPLSAEVPNRLLTWGLFRLPGQVTLAPFVEIRNGFPYSAIDDDWVNVGARNGLRMPWYGSLELSITRVVDLPRQLPNARVGLKLYNLASAHTERDVQRDIAATDFGVLYDPLPRDFAFVCVFLLGRH